MIIGKFALKIEVVSDSDRISMGSSQNINDLDI